MPDDPTLFDAPPLPAPAARRTPTSRAAARSVAPRQMTVARRIMAEMERAGEVGRTPDEAALEIGVSILTVRPRFTELAQAGHLVDTGLTRMNASGLQATVWRLARPLPDEKEQAA